VGAARFMLQVYKEKCGLELNQLLTLFFPFYASLIKDYKFVKSITPNFFDKPMLPPAYQQHYQELRQTLKQLSVSVAEAEQASAGSTPDLLRIQHFQRQLVLNSQELLPEQASRMRSYQTEINKQLRLLGTDLTFLKAAQQANTQQQRRRQVSDRLQVLIGYCNALLQPDNNQPGSS